jgi:beta-glucosidase/6-phospho-beta-glucosidase/beta-galactosidase
VAGAIRAPTTTRCERATSLAGWKSSVTGGVRAALYGDCFHWTGVDNYEWLRGFDLAFGIIDRDRNVKPSALVLRGEARP